MLNIFRFANEIIYRHHFGWCKLHSMTRELILPSKRNSQTSKLKIILSRKNIQLNASSEQQQRKKSR